MPRLDIDLSNGYYISESLTIANMECNNWYVYIPQASSALSKASLYGTPGVRQRLTSGNQTKVNRGAHVKNGKPYFLNGTELIRIDQSFDAAGNEILSYVILGEIPGEQRVSFADNGKQLMVLVPGGDGYIVDESSVTPFQKITDTDFKANGNPQYVTFIDSFFVVTTDTKKFIKSASNDGLNWNALDFGSAEADPDAIVAPINFKNRLFIGGSETIEVFENRGLGGFPFQRINGFIIPKGIFAPLSLINSNDAFMFIGGGVNESPAVWSVSGNNAQKISNTAIDTALQRFSQDEISQSFSYSYSQKGAYFVCFSFPTKTFCYDTITQRWHERTSKITDSKNRTQIIRSRVNSLVTAYNKVLVGDSVDGRIGELDIDLYTEYENQIIRTFSTIPFSSQGNPISVSQLEITMESGIGDFKVRDPQIRMSFSDDAKSFGNEIWRGIGRVGEYMKRCIFNRLGRVPRYRVFKFEMSDPVKPVVVKIEANARGGQIGS
jgi:hypothetical protein